MAISLVGTASNSGVNGANVTVTLPSGLAQNDVVVVFGGNGNSGTGASITTSGYTTLSSKSLTGQYSGLVAWKRMGASPDSTVVGAGGGSTADAVAYAVMVFRGVSTSTAIDATTIQTSQVSGDPNSGSITTVTNGAAVISCFVQNDPTNPLTLIAPSGYSSKVADSDNDTVDISTAGAYKIVTTAGAENPGVWSVGGHAWVAFTVALRPQASGTFGDGAFSAGTVKATASFTGSVAGSIATGAFSAGTNLGTLTWGGASLTTSPVPFTMTGRATVGFTGLAYGFGNATFTGTATVAFVGGRMVMTSVLEVVESRGAATVTVN